VLTAVPSIKQATAFDFGVLIMWADHQEWNHLAIKLIAEIPECFPKKTFSRLGLTCIGHGKNSPVKQN